MASLLTRSGWSLSCLGALLLVAGCSASDDDSKVTPGAGGGSGGSGAGNTGAGNTGASGGFVPIVDVTRCGNSALDPGEECDDGNQDGDDGCNPVCKLEADWECPTPGEPCISSAECGDGKLAISEVCDDNNTIGGDGCEADCSMVTPGWQCRIPGEACVPLCGDGIITDVENCDDGNDESGDGCSSTCLTEPGWSCEGTMCARSVCGNGDVEAGESCDAGEANGLFLGDGTGCTRTCTPEPTCRDANGNTTACATACGDGNLDAGEACDDGNGFDGDGCSASCTIEQGFACETQVNADVTPCSSDDGNCLVLPVTFRDFEPQGKPGGHPDFFWMGATSNTTDGARTTCVTNASGAPQSDWGGPNCGNSDSTEICTNLLADQLGGDGKPVVNPSSNLSCSCRFTDWDSDVLNGVGETCNVQGDGSTRRRIEKDVRTIKSADSFYDWYHDTDASETYVRTVELSQLGGTQQFQFTPSETTVYDDLHNIFLGNQTTLTSGFFPLENEAGTKYCNLWPYWIAEPSCTTQSGPIGQQWDPRGSYSPPTPGTGGPVSPVIGEQRNFYFTSEARYLFRFQGGEVLVFDGDDDFWVYVNGKLVLDFGSPHERLRATMTLAMNGTASWEVEGFNINTGNWDVRDTGTVNGLGMDVGKTYEIAFFHADRHPRESNYRLTLSSFETTRSICAPDCGDGVRAAGEECDDGEANDDTLYGGCTTECRFGPFCGDGEVNGEEECDAGRDTVPYGDPNGCTPGCTKAHYCGDGIVDTAFDEQCDEGPEGSQNCSASCRVTVQ